MYRQPPTIETPMDALDELADVRMTLSGLATLLLSTSKSQMHEPEAMELASCLLDYAAITTKSICSHLSSSQIVFTSVEQTDDFLL